MRKKFSEYLKQKSKSTFEGYIANLVLFIKENGQFPTRSQEVKLYNWIALQ